MQGIINLFNLFVSKLKTIDWLGPLALRLYLAPVFIAVGAHKFANFEQMVAWFGNPDWGLGLPMPRLMVFLAASAELFGGFALLLGLATRLFVLPLIITMLVAAATTHWENGWFAIAPSDPKTSTATVLAAVGIPAAEQSLQNSEAVGQRVAAAKSLLRRHGNYTWLTEKGSFVVLNNGIEFAVTYLIMLLSLLFTGGGRWVSADYWIARYLD
jgi:putative oxidoreductase